MNYARTFVALSHEMNCMKKIVYKTQNIWYNIAKAKWTSPKRYLYLKSSQLSAGSGSPKILVLKKIKLIKQ